MQDDTSTHGTPWVKILRTLASEGTIVTELIMSARQYGCISFPVKAHDAGVVSIFILVPLVSFDEKITLLQNFNVDFVHGVEK